jgi:hypothetical protein
MGALAHNIPCSRTLGSRCIYMIDTNDCAHIARFRSSCRILLIKQHVENVATICLFGGLDVKTLLCMIMS